MLLIQPRLTTLLRAVHSVAFRQAHSSHSQDDRLNLPRLSRDQTCERVSRYTGVQMLVACAHFEKQKARRSRDTLLHTLDKWNAPCEEGEGSLGSLKPSLVVWGGDCNEVYPATAT